MYSNVVSCSCCICCCYSCLQVNVDKVHGFEQYRGKCQPVFLLQKVSCNNSAGLCTVALLHLTQLPQKLRPAPGSCQQR